MASYRCLLHGAREIVLITSDNSVNVLTGSAMKSVEVLRRGETDSEGFSLAVDSNGKIAAIGRDSEVAQKLANAQFDRRLDVSGMVLVPGLIDAHTHPVWAGDRVHEFAMKLAGATYMQVHQAGGGIHFTVDKTRQASDEELWLSFKVRQNCLIYECIP